MSEEFYDTLKKMGVTDRDTGASEDDLSAMFSGGQERAAASRDGIINPQNYTNNLNNPLAKSLMAGIAGMQMAQKNPQFSGTGGDILTAMTGMAGAEQYNQQMEQDNLRIGQISPILAQKHPEIANMTLKQYAVMKDLIKEKELKQSEYRYTEEDLPLIKAYLETYDLGNKGYENLFVGRTERELKMFKGERENSLSRDRLKEQALQGAPLNGTFAIGEVPYALSYRPYGGQPNTRQIGNGKKDNDELVKLISNARKVNNIYDRAIKIAGKTPLGSFQKSIGAYLASDPDARALESTKGILGIMIAKGVAGEVGNLAQAEQDKAQRILQQFNITFNSGLPDTKKTIIAKKKIFKELIDTEVYFRKADAIWQALSSVSAGAFGDYSKYVIQLKKRYRNDKDMIKLINKTDSILMGEYKDEPSKTITEEGGQAGGFDTGALDKYLELNRK